MNILYERWQIPVLSRAMKTRRVLVLAGPRQCGKTTLAKQLPPDVTEYRTLDDHAQRELAQRDPAGFVKRKKKTLIIDEIQHVPELLSAIKIAVDSDTTPGQYLLTGSARIQSLPGVQESLAGRVRNLRLRPLSQGEILGAKPGFLKGAFQQKFPAKGRSYDRASILELAFRGGFPEVIALKERERRRWHQDYINALLERDLSDITRIQRHDTMRELVTVLAAWSGKYMDIAGIGSGLAIRRPTVESYINALEALFLVERVQAWTKTDYERVGRQNKLFVTDCGFMSSILGWREQQVEFDADRSGKLIETFVFNELKAQIDSADEDYFFYHYRDREKREIDFLIENENGDLLGIEIKAGSGIGNSDFKHLVWFRDNIARDRNFTGIVLYTGELSGSMGDRLWAVPFHSLWSE